MRKNASINILFEDQQVCFPECPISIYASKLTPLSKKKKKAKLWSLRKS